MAESSQQTDPQNNPGATGGEPQGDPAATNPKGGGSATGDSDQVTLSQEDYQNLVAARDRANEAARGNEGSEEFLLTLAKEREIGSFLKEHAEKYPDVSSEDLMHLDDPGQLEAEATRLQTRYEDIVQKKLHDVQIADNSPRLTDEERSQQIDALRNSNDPQAFEKMAKLRGF